jgi:hypothetical protein
MGSGGGFRAMVGLSGAINALESTVRTNVDISDFIANTGSTSLLVEYYSKGVSSTQ